MNCNPTTSQWIYELAHICVSYFGINPPSVIFFESDSSYVDNSPFPIINLRDAVLLTDWMVP